MKVTLFFLGVSFALLCSLPLCAQPSSASWVLQQSTLNNAGEDISSGSYRTTSSLSQQSVVGTSSSFNHVVQSGFWSYYGSGVVPIFLTVTRNVSVESDPDLSWSGNNEFYEVYRHDDCSLVEQVSSYLGTASIEDYTDTNPPGVTLLCYRVYAVAPGPAPPQEDPGPSKARQPEATHPKLPINIGLGN